MIPLEITHSIYSGTQLLNVGDEVNYKQVG